MAALSRKYELVLLAALLALSVIGWVPVQAQKMSSSADVSIANPSKEAKWTGKAIKGVTFAEMTINTNNDFNPQRSLAVDVGNKWIIPTNTPKQVTFLGLLMNPAANKYAPAFTGAFVPKQSGGGNGRGKIPEWNVKTEAIEVSNEHKYLEYAEANSGGTVKGTYKAAPTVDAFVVDLPLTNNNAVASYYDATSSFLYYIARVSITNKNAYTIVPCPNNCIKAPGVCKEAAKTTIELDVVRDNTEGMIQYPNVWKQDAPIINGKLNHRLRWS